MMFNILVLDNQERFIDFVDPNLIQIVETNEDGLKSVDITYSIEDLPRAKTLFKHGNKIWVSGNYNVEDCLYVINTSIKQDLFKENTFSFEAEEVLVELNNAHLFKQTDLTARNGFTLSTVNGEQNVLVDWNALNFWFGDYFNIGIVQDCVSAHAQKIVLSGTMTLMSLLRYIESETGNRFVTRYEKDITSNVIHRYLDFMNPDNENKNWELNLHYDFEDLDIEPLILDEEGNYISDKYDDVEEEDDLVEFKTVNEVVNLNPEDIVFRITYNGEVITNRSGAPLEWDSETIGFEETTEKTVICLSRSGTNIALTAEVLSIPVSDTENSTLQSNKGYITYSSEKTIIGNVEILNGSCLEFYDAVLEKVVFSHAIYPNLNYFHEEILDLGFNVDNIELETSEENTFSAISPVFSLSQSDSVNGLSRQDLSKIINAWVNLEVVKGQTIPMFVQKQTVTGDYNTTSKMNQFLTDHNVKDANGNISKYYSRPLHPQDNIDSSTASNSTHEFWVATAFWNAPFTKLRGDLDITLDSNLTTNYPFISGRPDTRDVKGTLSVPKMGTVDTSDEDIYNIYNAVAMKLKECSSPEINLTVDVAQFLDGLYNNFNVNDKVYIKMPGADTLITANVEKTVKNPHDISENKITLSNYSINSKTVLKQTYIDAANTNFKYPSTKELPIFLVNAEYDSTDETDVQFLAGKVITFTVWKYNDSNEKVFYKTYVKKTNRDGLAKINMNFKPAEYEIDIYYGGDAVYEESLITIEVSVGGKIQKKKTDPKKKKDTNKTKNETVKKKRYWGKDGVSPDKKYVKGVGRPSSAGEVDRYGYTFYEAEVENVCPGCHRKGGIQYDIFFAGNEVSNWGFSKIFGTGEGSSAEGLFHCKYCDRDWSVFGKEHGYQNTHLKMHKKAVKSKKSRAYDLRKGKLYYDTVVVNKKAKKKANTKARSTGSSSIPSKIRKKALSIVGDSRGVAACKKIANYFLGVRWVNYNNYQRSPLSVLNSGAGNCCDQTLLMLMMMDSVGVRQDGVTLRWIHVVGGEGGHVFARVEYTNKKGKRVQTIVDPCAIREGPWGHYSHGYGSYPSQIRHSPVYTGPSSRAF